MKKIAIITTKWNENFVGPCVEGCIYTLHEKGVEEDQIDVITVPGSIEIPLTAKLLAQTGKYSAVIAVGFIYGGGIYRHEFVAQGVIDEIIRLQTEIELPILSSVLTPVSIDMNKQDEVDYYTNHMRGKGVEVAESCLEIIEIYKKIQK